MKLAIFFLAVAIGAMLFSELPPLLYDGVIGLFLGAFAVTLIVEAFRDPFQ